MSAEDQIKALKRLLEIGTSIRQVSETKQVSETTEALIIFFRERDTSPWIAITSMVTLIGICMQKCTWDSDSSREEIIEKISETLRTISKM